MRVTTQILMSNASSGLSDIIKMLLLIIHNLSLRLVETQQLLELLNKENLELKVKLNRTRRVFAPKNEQASESEKSDPQQPKRKRGAQPGRKQRSRNIPETLPKHDVILDFEDVPCCPKCDIPYARVSAFDKVANCVEASISAVHEIVTRYSYKKGCNCSETKKIITAPNRKSVIKKSILTTGTWVHLIIMKYLLAVPVYRYRQALKPTGFDLSPATVENGFKKIGSLMLPVYNALSEELRKSPIWNADETRWKVFEMIKNKSSFLWWLWVFASKDVVLYVIDPSRSANVIRKVNKWQDRIFAADRFSSYEAIKGGKVFIAYCWVHLRRDFINLKAQKLFKNNPAIEKWVNDWLCAIRIIFKLNKQRLKCTSEKQFAEITEKLRVITGNLYQQNVNDLEYDFQKKILKSFKKRYSGYTIFIDNPNVPLDNNRAEQLLKTGINGRKNYLGNVSSASVQHTQIFLSIIATAKNNDIAPQKWFEEYLNACAENDSKPLDGQILIHHVNKLLNRPS
jgi:transposase